MRVNLGYKVADHRDSHVGAQTRQQKRRGNLARRKAVEDKGGFWPFLRLAEEQQEEVSGSKSCRKGRPGT